MQLDKPRITMPPKEFGAFIRKKRMEKGFTQSTVANFLGVTKGAVSHWEQGRVEGIDPVNLFRLASLLEFGEEHINQLFPDRFTDLANAPAFDPEGDAVRVMKVYANLPTHVRQAIKAVILNTAASLENLGKPIDPEWPAEKRPDDELPSVSEVDTDDSVDGLDKPDENVADLFAYPAPVTQCPRCESILYVTPAMLQEAEVRCGRCGARFDPRRKPPPLDTDDQEDELPSVFETKDADGNPVRDNEPGEEEAFESSFDNGLVQDLRSIYPLFGRAKPSRKEIERKLAKLPQDSMDLIQLKLTHYEARLRQQPGSKAGRAEQEIILLLEQVPPRLEEPSQEQRPASNKPPGRVQAKQRSG